MQAERNPKYCFQCDDGTVLVHDTRDVSGVVNGEPYSVKQVRGWHCPACGEIEFTPADDDSSERFTAAMEAAAVKSREVSAQALRAIRKKLRLSQTEAGRLFGGGTTGFSEYERGKTQPPKSTVLLLRLLDRHPELLGELGAVA